MTNTTALPRQQRRRADRQHDKHGCPRCGGRAQFNLYVLPARGEVALVCQPCKRPSDRIVAKSADILTERTAAQAADRQWFIDNPDAETRVRPFLPGERKETIARHLLRAAQLGLGLDPDEHAELVQHQDHVVVVKVDFGRVSAGVRLAGLSPAERQASIDNMAGELRTAAPTIYADTMSLSPLANSQHLNAGLLEDLLASSGVDPAAWRARLRANVQAAANAAKH